MDESPQQIQIQNLWKVFGSAPDRAFTEENRNKSRAEVQEELGLVVALRDVSFEVNTGEVFVVMGLSGSGKSTLVRCLIRLIEATQGEIIVDGENVCEYSQEQLIEFRRSKIAMVFQNFGLLPHKNVLDNVSYGLEVRGVDREERFETAVRMLELVGLDGWEEARVRQLSGGMQQRVGLARALAVEPAIMLMDEPFSGLDPLIRKQMRKELADLQQEIHKTIVFITHDLDEAITVGDRIAIMRDGEIIQMGTPKDIILNPVDDFVAEFTEDISRSRVIDVGSVMEAPEHVSRASGGIISINNEFENSAASYSVCVDDAERVLGVLTRASLVTDNHENFDVAKTLSKPPASLSTKTNIEDAIAVLVDVDSPVPVVDSDSRLVGVVTHNTLLRSIGPNR